MGRILEGLVFLAVSILLGLADRSVIRNRPGDGRALIDWWVEESRTASGRRKWTSGAWGGDKYRDPANREVAARLTSINLIVLLTTGSLVFLALALSFFAHA